MPDLFNSNISNDYINPDLAPCAGSSDTATFEFLPGQQVGVVSGNATLVAMDWGDLSQEVTGWNEQTRLVQSGEVIFIPGLTKGVTYKTQYFPIDGSVAYDTYLDPLYMSADISISYYQNFRYYNVNVHATSAESLGINIADAFNVELGARGINVYTSWDASKFTFTGSTAGYEFNVSAIDVSRWTPDTSIVGNSLDEDVSARIPSAKYPNTGMLGYMLKVTYPSTITNDYDKWVYLKHAPDDIVFYEPNTGDPDSYVRYYKTVDVGMNGSSSDTVMSAGDYLNWVTVNNQWEKVGIMRAWIAAEDPANSNTENLLTGFYIFNPQVQTIQIDYITLI